MKYLILLSLFIFIGCGYSPIDAYNSVAKKYPSAKIAQIPGRDYQFVIQTESGEIRYIEVMNTTNSEITLNYRCF